MNKSQFVGELALYCSCNERIIYGSCNERIILLVVLLYIVPTESIRHNTELIGYVASP